MSQVLLGKYGIVPSNDMQLYRAKRKMLETNNDNVENYSDKSFTTRIWMVSYSEIIHPMPDIDVNTRDDYPLIDLPPLKRMPSRPSSLGEKAMLRDR
ncbi:hypothetical protein JHK85_010283 [Glycine max]|nr:hypothetical protein JHK85_010283 [Glycine max]KAG5066271.1 hypothetical protein JHK86_010002 [Glycine max]